MKISAINVSQYNHPNFKGIFINKGESHESYSYDGSPSGTNPGHYAGYSNSVFYTYHPFADESEEHIKEVLRNNNYSRNYDPDMTGGYGGGDDCTTTRGKTLPYTEAEWNRLPKSQQHKIRSLLA